MNLAHKYPVPYDKKVEEQKDHSLVPTIIDIGCGYGGLMFELSKEYRDKLILGMEIRDVVANFVVDKATTKKINSGHKNYLNIGVVKTNTMKTLHNYFRKESVIILMIEFYIIAREDVLLFCRPPF